MEKSTMKRKNDNLKEWLFAGFVLVVLVTLIFTGIEGKKQDRARLADYLEYQKAEEYYSQGDFEEAYPIFQKLIEKPEYRNSVVLNWAIAQILKDRGEYSEALVYYDHIWKCYPAIVNNPIFLEEYVGALSQTGDERIKLYQQTD